MKKLFSAAAAAALCVAFCIGCMTGCDKNEVSYGSRVYSSFSNTVIDDGIRGEFYSDQNGFLHFIDFDVLESVYVCSRPNCLHSDESCSAYGLSDSPGYHDGRLYFSVAEKVYDADSGRFVDTLVAYSSDIDGSNRAEHATAEGYVSSSVHKVIPDGVIYLGVSFTGDFDDDDYPQDGYTESCVLSYDTSSQTFKRLCSVGSPGYRARIELLGIVDGYIYFSYTDGSETNEVPERGEGNAAKFGRCSVSDGSVEDVDMYITGMSEGYLICKENGGIALYSDGGNRTYIEDFQSEFFDQYDIYSGYLYSPYVDFAVDISTGERYLLKEFEGTIRAGYDGGFIAYVLSADEPGGRKYFKYSKDDILGEKL